MMMNPSPSLKVIDDDTSAAELDAITAAQDAKGGVFNDPDLAAMNARYAVVKVGGKTRVVALEESPAYPGSMVPVFSTIPDFCAFHAKRKKEITGPDGKPKRIGIGKWWVDHEERRQFDAIVYAPNVNEPNRLNLWIGFGCDPRPGDCNLYLAHLLENICGNNSEHSEYLIGWMAYAAQHPERQGEVAVVLRGREGVGKGVFAKEFGRLFGSHFKHIVNAKHLVGHFNAHLQHCSVLFADEAFFAGDRSHESVLKGLITEETLLVEPKGVDSYSVRNCIHLVMSSNSDWVVPAGADARRYFVLDVSAAHMQDYRYFAAIARQMDNGGRAALLHYLLNLDVTTFDVRAVPQTAALADQKTRSRRGVDRLVEIVAHSGILPAADVSHPNVAVAYGQHGARQRGWTMRPKVTLRAALDDPLLLDMGHPSWLAWRSLLMAMMGEPLLPDELDAYRSLTGRTDPPRSRVDEFWGVIGRRGGKSRSIATLAVYIAALCEHAHLLSPGERGLVVVIAPDRDQAAIILGYASGLMEHSPVLRQYIARKTTEEIELTNGITIEVRTASFRRLRGFTSIAVIADECAFWYSDESANPDVEILTAVRPTLATTAGPLIAISSPHARKGAMWTTYQRHYGRDGDPAILVAQGPTLALNLERYPDGRLKLQGVVDRAYERDAAAAAAEYGAQFRSDLESFVSLELVNACTDEITERPFDRACGYVAFADPSGGSADSFALAIAHMEDNIATLDLVREAPAPFAPSVVVEDFANVLKSYGLRTVTGDRYAGMWPSESFARNGITYEPSELNKPELYREALPLLTSRTAALLNNDRLQRQLTSLERRTMSGGREIIDHPKGGRDDLANAAAGALVLTQHAPAAGASSKFNRPIDYPVARVA